MFFLKWGLSAAMWTHGTQLYTLTHSHTHTHTHILNACSLLLRPAVAAAACRGAVARVSLAGGGAPVKVSPGALCGIGWATSPPCPGKCCCRWSWTGCCCQRYGSLWFGVWVLSSRRGMLKWRPGKPKPLPAPWHSG